MNKLLILIGLLIYINSFGQPDSYKTEMDNSWSQLTDTTFTELLDENNLVYTMPVGFEPIEVKKNYNVFYQYAITNTNSNFEIRIFIKSFKEMDDTANFNPNDFSYNFLTSISLNASGNVLPNIPQIDLFPKEAVKLDFNADWGATTAFAPNTDFGKGFHFCALNCIRLDNVCEVYVFYMFDDAPNQEALMKKGFHVMKFKD